MTATSSQVTQGTKYPTLAFKSFFPKSEILNFRHGRELSNKYQITVSLQCADK